MKLYEYMGKELFARYGIALPSERVARTADEAEAAAKELGPVVIKGQVLSGKRGKAGAVAFADTPEEAFKEGERILKLQVAGEDVKCLLVAEKIKIEKELYLAITVDGARRKPVILASASGGMDIEDVPPEEMVTWELDVTLGYQPFVGREVGFRMGLSGALLNSFVKLLGQLYKMFRELDAELVEINPLAVCGDSVVAADSKVTIDDDALYRHKDLPHVEERTDLEKKAHEMGIAYVDLGGDIAVMANGAGITMATLDLVEHYGGTPANFLDFGGGAGVEKTSQAMELLLGTGPKVILINIFGGITRCDDVAGAFAQVKANKNINVPVFFRLVGTNEDEGRAILKGINIEAYSSMDEAVRAAAEAATVPAKGGVN